MPLVLARTGAEGRRYRPNAALEVAHVLLRLGEQRAQRLGDIGKTEVGRLLHPLAVALELPRLQREVGLQRFPRVGGGGDVGHARARLTAEEAHLLGERRRMLQLLPEVHLELGDRARELGAADRRDVPHVLHDRLELTSRGRH